MTQRTVSTLRTSSSTHLSRHSRYQSSWYSRQRLICPNSGEEYSVTSFVFCADFFNAFRALAALSSEHSRPLILQRCYVA